MVALSYFHIRLSLFFALISLEYVSYTPTACFFLHLCNLQTTVNRAHFQTDLLLNVQLISIMVMKMPSFCYSPHLSYSTLGLCCSLASFIEPYYYSNIIFVLSTNAIDVVCHSFVLSDHPLPCYVSNNVKPTF